MDDMTIFEQRLASGLEQLAGPPRPVDALAISRSVTTQSAKWRLQPMFNATKFVIAGLIVALFGGFLLSGVLTPSPDRDALPAAVDTSASSPSPTVSPTPSASDPDEAVAAIVWSDAGVHLEADAMRIKTNGLVFKGPGALISMGGFVDESDIAELEGQWKEHGKLMRLRFELRSDGTDWWITRMRTYDGVSPDGEYLDYGGLKDSTRTPVGQSFEADLDLPATGGDRPALASKARLRIDGLRLTAFAPGTRPAPLTGCEPLPSDAGVAAKVNKHERVDYFGEGALLHGLDQLSPAEASRRLTDLGICHEFRYQYPLADHGPYTGFSERWCTLPTAVRPRADGPPTLILDDRHVLIWVTDDEPRERREQPPAGWGCPTY